VSYGGVTVLNNVQTPYPRLADGAPKGCSALASAAPTTIIGSTTCASGRWLAGDCAMTSTTVCLQATTLFGDARVDAGRLKLYTIPQAKQFLASLL